MAAREQVKDHHVLTRTRKSMITNLRTIGSLIVLCALLLVGACSDSTGPETSPVGTFELVELNGNPLPYELLGSEILSATLTLREDGTYTIRTVSRFEDPFTGEIDDYDDLETGTYSLTGNVLTVTQTEGSTVEATYQGDTIELDGGFVVMLFRRT